MPDAMQTPGYARGKRLRSSPRSEVFDAVYEADRSPVVLKSYLDDRSQHPGARARAEFEILRRFDSERLPRALDLDRSNEKPVLVLEKLPGVPLSQLLEEGPLSLDLWLDVACDLAEALRDVHGAHVLHKDVTPSNVLVDPRTHRAWLVDFGVAQELGAAERPSAVMATHAETLGYVAPEQTGRMNRGCDARSDLYSLGATLYHALCGRPPYEGSDPLELIHAHVARLPTPPCELHARIPPLVSDLVLKLLRKQPEERYASAAGLLADLRWCASSRDANGQLTGSIELGALEASSLPRFGSVPVGRDRELEELRAAFDRVASDGVQCVIIEGASGIGKSALVEAFTAPLATRGRFIASKFDRYADRPFAAWTRALEALTHQLLLERDAELARHRLELGSRIGNIAGVLIELVPDLRFILGELPRPPRLSPAEAQTRLALAVARLIHACAVPEHPVVLCFDDLQWADGGSLALLHEVVAHHPASPLLLLLTVRTSPDTDLDDAQGLDTVRQFRSFVHAQGVPLSSLPLAPIGSEACVTWLSRAVERSEQDARPLAAWIERKTGNNPLLIRQFVEYCCSRGLLWHEPGSGWHWNADEIARAETPAEAVGLLESKLAELPADILQVLQFAACVRDEFDVATLAELNSRPRAQLESALHRLSDSGLILPSRSGYRFAHDRIRETARNQLPDADRRRLHFDMACLLLERIPIAEQAFHTLEIVEHLNRGIDHADDALCDRALGLNLQAALILLSQGAANGASDCLETARELIQSRHWEQLAQLCIQIHLHGSEARFQCGDLDGALEWLEPLERLELAPLERAVALVRRLQVYASTRSLDEYCDYGLECLREFGVIWPRHPSRFRIRAELFRIERAYSKHRETLPESSGFEPRIASVMILIAATGALLTRVHAGFSALAACWGLKTLLTEGTQVGVPYILSTYVTFSYLFTRNTRHTLRRMEQLLELNRGTEAPLLRARTDLTLYALLQPWFVPRRTALAETDRIAELALEGGDRHHAYYIWLLRSCFCALAGDPLAQVESRWDELAETERRWRLTSGEASLLRQPFDVLRGASYEPDRVLAELEQSRARVSPHARHLLPYLATFWMQTLSVIGRFDVALEQADSVSQTISVLIPWVHTADFTFYRGLAAAAVADTRRGWRRRSLRAITRSCARELRRIAAHGPDFPHMQWFLEAELLRLSGKLERARQAYERAAHRARKQEFVHHAALACERRAAVLARLNRQTERSASLREAAALYRAWGAEPKARALEQIRGAGERRHRPR